MKRWLLPEEGNFYKANLHLHTTLSDGDFTPETVKRMYVERGYSILAFTDHDVFIPHNDFSDDSFLAVNAHESEIGEFPDTPTRYMKTYHLNFYAKSADAKFSPVFSESRVHLGASPALVTDEMRKTDVEAHYSIDSINNLIRIANENGFFVTYNHPVWSLQNYPDYCGLEGLWGIEVFNTGCVVNDQLPDTTVPFDDLLRQGKSVFPICADDSHEIKGCFGGWTMVKAPKLDYDSVISALLAGNFYSSTGPEIRELWIEDNNLHIRTSGDAKIVTVITDWRNEANRRFPLQKDGDECVADFPIRRFGRKYREKNYPGWENTYIRFEVEDGNGKKAYTRAFFIRDLPEMQ